MQKSFNCLCFLDNYNICIMEISRPVKTVTGYEKNHEWLLLRKDDMSIKALSLKSRDDSYEVEERYFNLGYLKYNPKQGVFIETANMGQHPLQNSDCNGIPETYLQSIENYIDRLALQPC